ncbi:hypothetical protein BGZ79_010270, partial [Entomortierella chlamydospora]
TIEAAKDAFQLTYKEKFAVEWTERETAVSDRYIYETKTYETFEEVEEVEEVVDENKAQEIISEQERSIWNSPTIKSIGGVESTMPPLRGPGASLEEYLKHRDKYAQQLGHFYNDQTLYKKYQRDAKSARNEEYRRIADSLLRMIGGSIGSRRKEGEKVVIGVGLGKFSAQTKLSSLHGTFESYFVQLVKS